MNKKHYLKRIKGNGKSPQKRPLNEIIWSSIGGFVGIYFVSIFNHLLLADLENNLFLIGSFGASAVLIYGAPYAEFSQPRNLLGGHILSALVGISVYKIVPLDITTLAALAVSMSILVMHLTKTLHPPGGATALIAVIGSQEVHNLGYLFVLYPVIPGVLILLIIALIVNNLSNNPNRHYPKCWF